MSPLHNLGNLPAAKSSDNFVFCLHLFPLKLHMCTTVFIVQHIISKLALKALRLSSNSYSEVLIYLRKTNVCSHLIPMNLAAADRLLGNNKKALAINIILIANAFIWYVYSFSFLVKTTIELSQFSDQLLLIITINFLGLFAALIIGEFLSQKMKNRLTFLLLWMFAGIFLSLVPLTAGTTDLGGMTYLSAVLFSVITGINFGFGIPICLGYFASTTEATSRGKSGGIIFLLTGLGAFLISGIGDNSFLSVSLLLAIWRTVGFIALLFVSRSVVPIPVKTKIPYRKILANRNFILYFIPWTMFLIVNSLSFPINQTCFFKD